MRFVLSLLTWQTSFIVASIAALLLSGIVVIATPDTVGADNQVDVSKIPLTSPSIVRFSEPIDDITFLVYDTLGGDSTKPIDIEVQEDERGAFFKLFPGVYSMTFLRDGYETVETKVTIKVGQKRILLRLSFEESPESPFSSPLNEIWQ